MAKRKTTRTRVVLKTVLLVGEGHSEKAFLEHLKSLYISRGCGVHVTIRNAYGKGPEHVIEKVTRYARNADFKLKAALLDEDIPWSPQIIQYAKRNRVSLIGSSPCLEGFLLKILNQPVPDVCKTCKDKLHPQLPGKPTLSSSYAGLFSKASLETRRSVIEDLENLIKILTGGAGR
ncbi:MAG: RloB domain-containing protein [Gammaproteobacteria bacterium]|nr:RloB domain-containing protein [Gammaproteobacteria bacterium]